MKKENDKDLVKAMKYLNDKIADITDTIASMETKLEKLERQVSILDENMHQVDWTVGSFDNDTFKPGPRRRPDPGPRRPRCVARRKHSSLPAVRR